MIRTHYLSDKQKQEALTPKHIKQANKIAWSWHKTTRISFCELQSEAYLAICEAVNAFDPKQGNQLSTVVHRYVEMAVRSFCQRQKKHVLSDQEPQIKGWHPCPDSFMEFKEQVEQLGEDAKDVVRIIFEGPTEFLIVMPDISVCKLRGEIRQYLKSLGASNNKTKQIFNEIKSIFK